MIRTGYFTRSCNFRSARYNPGDFVGLKEIEPDEEKELKRKGWVDSDAPPGASSNSDSPAKGKEKRP